MPSVVVSLHVSGTVDLDRGPTVVNDVRGSLCSKPEYGQRGEGEIPFESVRGLFLVLHHRLSLIHELVTTVRTRALRPQQVCSSCDLVLRIRCDAVPSLFRLRGQ